MGGMDEGWEMHFPDLEEPGMEFKSQAPAPSRDGSSHDEGMDVDHDDVGLIDVGDLG